MARALDNLVREIIECFNHCWSKISIGKQKQQIILRFHCWNEIDDGIYLIFSSKKKKNSSQDFFVFNLKAFWKLFAAATLILERFFIWFLVIHLEFQVKKNWNSNLDEFFYEKNMILNRFSAFWHMIIFLKNYLAMKTLSRIFLQRHVDGLKRLGDESVRAYFGLVFGGCPGICIGFCTSKVFCLIHYGCTSSAS